ncbi:MAG: SDR family NAD(P)-dependent oxidoreductase [Verrucomicrobia bacterium]|nr:SDR family NAD(P)-dependent oxidoreductase [Verrucomicrobiota bacterium]
MRRKPNGASLDIEKSLFSKNGDDKRPVLITGGAGFIGTNVADRFLSAGHSVIIYDNISRPGVEQNLRWLQETHGSQVQIVVAEMRDAANLRYIVGQVSKVFHFAAQVAVTTSLISPVDDFEINARGTLNLLEAIRSLRNPPPLIFTSTNKVYGHLADVKMQENGDRYEPVDAEFRNNGFSEKRALDFHSPYGCSKGAAEQYVLDYARTFKIPALVFRMSCIYGLHQFGNEDQGWVAHFLIRALEGNPITIYGDGKQVRDILFIEDLVNAFLLAHEHMGELSGKAFNIGGGPDNTISLLELLDLIAEVNGERPEVEFDTWRSADQQYYVSDIRRFSAATGWSPRVGVCEGVTRLYDWLLANRTLSPLDANRVDGKTVSLNEAKQLSIMHSLQQTREPRSKRLWQEAHGNNGIFTPADGRAGR